MAAKVGKLVWTGRVLSGIVGLLFLMSATMKFIGGAEVKKGMDQFGIPEVLVQPLGILEITCVVIYLIPQTSILGAILLTGYLGGAICTHLRVGDNNVAFQVGIGVVVWLALWLREGRLRSLIPLRF